MSDQQTITTVTTAVTGLAACTRILPHDLRRAAGALQALDEQHRLRATGGADVGEQVSMVLRALLNAERALQVANVHLREAGGTLTLMGDQPEDAAASR